MTPSHRASQVAQACETRYVIASSVTRGIRTPFASTFPLFRVRHRGHSAGRPRPRQLRVTDSVSTRACYSPSPRPAVCSTQHARAAAIVRSGASATGARFAANTQQSGPRSQPLRSLMQPPQPRAEYRPAVRHTHGPGGGPPGTPHATYARSLRGRSAPQTGPPPHLLNCDGARRLHSPPFPLPQTPSPYPPPGNSRGAPPPRNVGGGERGEAVHAAVPSHAPAGIPSPPKGREYPAFRLSRASEPPDTGPPPPSRDGLRSVRGLPLPPLTAAPAGLQHPPATGGGVSPRSPYPPTSPPPTVVFPSCFRRVSVAITRNCRRVPVGLPSGSP